MKISELTPAEVLNDEDLFSVVQNGETKKVKRRDLFKNLPIPTEYGDATPKGYVDAQFKNVEKHYRTEYDVTTLNGLTINIDGNYLYPFKFTYSKQLIAGGAKTQIIIRFNITPSFTITATGEEYIIFSNSPKASDITKTTPLFYMDGVLFEATWDEVIELFKDSLSDENAIAKHEMRVQETEGTYVYDTFYDELYIETTDIDGANAIYEEIEPLLSLVSKIAVDYKEIDVITQEGKLIYE